MHYRVDVWAGIGPDRVIWVPMLRSGPLAGQRPGLRAMLRRIAPSVAATDQWSAGSGSRGARHAFGARNARRLVTGAGAPAPGMQA